MPRSGPSLLCYNSYCLQLSIGLLSMNRHKRCDGVKTMCYVSYTMVPCEYLPTFKHFLSLITFNNKLQLPAIIPPHNQSQQTSLCPILIQAFSLPSANPLNECGNSRRNKGSRNTSFSCRRNHCSKTTKHRIRCSWWFIQ